MPASRLIRPQSFPRCRRSHKLYSDFQKFNRVVKIMKKGIVTVIIGTALAVILTGCSLSGLKSDSASKKEEENVQEQSAKTPLDQEETHTGEEEDKVAPADKSAETPQEQNEAENPGTDETDDFWKELYLKKLDRVREQMPAFDADTPADEYTPIEYYLYDIDKDGIPEMIIKYGTCEADYHGDIYTNDGYAVTPVETDIGMGHTVFWTDPEENGIILNWGHMGSQGMQRLSIVDGRLESKELFEETIQGDEDYTSVDKIVPGAVMLSCAQMYQNIYVTHYEDIMKGMTSDPQPTRGKEPDKELADAVDNVITYGGAVVCNSADGYGPNLGTIPFDEMLKKLDQWSNKPFEIDSKEYIDLNDDGRQECVLWLKQHNDGYDSTDVCVLNLQDGKMYAYIVEYVNGFTLQDNGSFVGTEYNELTFRLIFDRDECMRYYVKQ